MFSSRPPELGPDMSIICDSEIVISIIDYTTILVFIDRDKHAFSSKSGQHISQYVEFSDDELIKR